MREGYRKSTRASGFQNNAQLFDETSWATEKNTHTDIVRTEYRNRYNKDKPFHKPSLLNSHGRLKKREQVYDLQDVDATKNWKARMGQTKVFTGVAGAEHSGHEGFKV